MIQPQVGWGFTTGYDPWLGESQVSKNLIQSFCLCGKVPTNLMLFHLL